MLLNEPVNDFDIYFKTKDSLKAVSEYYTKKFNENNLGKLNKIGYRQHSWVLDGEDVELWKQDKKRLSTFAYGYNDIEYSDVKDWVYIPPNSEIEEADFTEAEEITEKNKIYLQVSGMLLNTPTDRIKIMVNSDGIAEDSDSVADNAEYDIDAYLDALSDGDSMPAGEVEKEDETKRYRPVFLSTNAITLSNKIQIVVRFYGEIEEIHKNYDFVHATNYWTYEDGTVLNQKALECILNKELHYIGSKYPICSLVRTRKFIKRGWQINAGQYVKMAFQISKLDLENIYVLEDQLVGVDSIYFLNFIHCMKERYLKDKDFVLTSDYLSTVIDKLFG